MGTVAGISNLEFTDPEERGLFCSPSPALFLSLLYSSCSLQKKGAGDGLTQDGCMNMESFSAGLASGVGRRLISAIQEDKKGQHI